MNRTWNLIIWSFAGLCALLFAALPAHAGPEHKTVRLAVVNTPHFSGLIDFLLEGFKKETGLRVEVYSGQDVYQRARAGQADIVISHYGKPDVESFVLDGYGLWPKTVFSNQLVLIGPEKDPANIRGLTSATGAFRRIAKTQSPFIANPLRGVTYLTDILWEAAGRPKKGAWFLETGVMKGRAIRLADEKQGYVIWGAYPFLRFKGRHNSKMQILVSRDPILQRVMAVVLVNPQKVSNLNHKGASALQRFLLKPRTQAQIAAFRSRGSAEQLWWPAGRDNAPENYSR